ncbi:unnamed protein product [Clavelina lepadiformis]|uniref:Uncharacterized protein n=1 Tax=Clavelina lepadiformis TaxID=159417 RepID=A0ABP0H3U4_CLALP
MQFTMTKINRFQLAMFVVLYVPNFLFLSTITAVSTVNSRKTNNVTPDPHNLDYYRNGPNALSQKTMESKQNYTVNNTNAMLFDKDSYSEDTIPDLNKLFPGTSEPLSNQQINGDVSPNIPNKDNARSTEKHSGRLTNCNRHSVTRTSQNSHRKIASDIASHQRRNRRRNCRRNRRRNCRRNRRRNRRRNCRRNRRRNRGRNRDRNRRRNHETHDLGFTSTSTETYR